MEKIVKTNKPEETKELGKQLGLLAKENMVFTLTGDLGAGKTTLTQGIAKGLNIEKTVSSPTFTILKIYHGRMDLYHFDAYRLEGLHQDLGFEEMIDGDGLTVIEWPMYIQDMIGEEFLEIEIKFIEEEVREFVLKANGKAYEELLGEIQL
ncbi:tRNA (adenosine(37)-N6)-threonylcarbamoyltransferase complex ATPase subunit type 1 TsaE [Anaerorhabdus sp.]|jgi:tRNA threonylcarbamoyladenosine biosynthesis protein TsaE|uniref:tRNA (adenosine(37)-N6)-threonylcarbamoyltransferase complex ATPase subunit type 1 TsaE n=1 Tax=Anaerorhabdus sp. TaxID=1872524 RepID=UPI002B1F6D76|nr:tRNA (adenosine(37)-N6)-threonylcarbamoyltransferase complex ATPase subunit type 1 TsaE [Anaerorhabdus sp.]MEA4874784.1 tRNA (adenosine(37)-N6)-threonylcarbamoyltransferase complex ATPase subunit type 1 TsaE [Anaerorhabdus sp.]